MSGAELASQARNSHWRQQAKAYAPVLTFWATVVITVVLGLSRWGWLNHQAGVCSAWQQKFGANEFWDYVTPSAAAPTAAPTGSIGTRKKPLPKALAAALRALAEAKELEMQKNASDTRMFVNLVSKKEDEDNNWTCAVGSEPEELTENKSLQVPEADLALRSHAVWLPLCEALNHELGSLRKAKRSTLTVNRALSLLVKLHKLERPFRHLLTDIHRGAVAIKAMAVTFAAGSTTAQTNVISEDDVKESGAHSGNDNSTHVVLTHLRTLSSLRAVSRTCMLQALKEGRLIALALPLSDPTVQQAVACKPPLLAELEGLVLREAENDKDASVMFALGLYWSELGVATEDAPLFGVQAQDWGSIDDVGTAHEGRDDEVSALSSHRVPAAIARAEVFMLRGEERTLVAGERTERGAMRALRLYQHAKCLALMHHDIAAESRYLNAAQVAASNGRSKLAGHALTRLSYFLSLRGKSERSLDVAGQALVYGSDPLAEYLKATLRRSLGELRTSAEIFEAEAVLKAVAGRLPSGGLEQQRILALNELQVLRHMATEGGIEVCYVMQDAARFLLCMFCKLIFPETPVLIQEVPSFVNTVAAASAESNSSHNQDGNQTTIADENDKTVSAVKDMHEDLR